ncbi:MAG: YceI family protein [Bacteroidales bacterium]|nr:YceI family protein [Bacteroidales bacterium]
MRKTVFMLAIAGTMLFASCGNSGNKVESQDAQAVEQATGDQVVEYSKVMDGSHVAWRASHLAGVQPRWGRAFIKEALIKVENNQVVNAKVVMDMNNFTVENFGDDAETTQKLLTHLQSDDFFKIATFPISTFEITAIAAAEGDYNSSITGNLTILDVTKSITFKANIMVADNEVSIKSEDFIVDRRDWGLTYNTEGTVGVPTDYLIADEVGFTIDVKMSK